MKYKKYSYILLLILMLTIGVNKTYAAAAGEKHCFYMSSDANFKVSVKFQWGYKNPGWHGKKSFAKASVDKLEEGVYTFDPEPILNIWNDKCVKGGEFCINPIYESKEEANNTSNPTCPNYVIFQHNVGYKVWATNDESVAKQAIEEITDQGAVAYYASNKDANGNQITSEMYYSEFVAEGLMVYDENEEITCADYERIFGDPKDDGETYDPDNDGHGSIRYMINELLQYVRVIVPILVILLGTLDLAKAVIAGKEDNMQKARTDFIKRVIIGVAVFFVPLFIDVVMWLADIVWAGEYMHCGL